MRTIAIALIYSQLFFQAISLTNALVLSPRKLVVEPIRKGYAQRIKADDSFALKSITEVLLAAGTQFSAEWSKRGPNRIAPEIDFVIAGILTAVAGKYYTMWRVAPTLLDDDDDDDDGSNDPNVDKNDQQSRLVGSMPVPTNAFQPTMPDGVTKPSMNQRLGSALAPVGPLFRAGIIASAIGYGTTALMIFFRSLCVPSYTTATQNMNIIYACIYTGAFMAVVSNLRYQILQGLIEPAVDRWFKKQPALRGFLVFWIRWANGFLGSILAISGMKALGLQRLK